MTEEQDAAIVTIAMAQHGVFSRAQAKERGFTPRQIERKLARRRWILVAPNVYALPQWERTFEQRAFTAQLYAGDGSFVSHRCAAMLRELDGVKRAGIDVTTSRRVRPLKGVTIHYSTDATGDEWVDDAGLRIATVTRILLDLAATGTSLKVLERVYECGVRRGETDLPSLAALCERVARRGKRTSRLAQLVERVVRDGRRNGSDAETLFFQILRDAGLPLPTRQRQVLREDVSFAYSDYAYDDVDAVLEVLGYRWHSSRNSLDRDAERNNDLNLSGKTLLEFTWTHLTEDRDYIVRTVERLLEGRRAA
ncbi:MAG TPA: hypothetical protein VM345_06665 [Acidimicrobiales bacterium]|nr:hypothetical protein [Acidimicrobiales bacterium]